MNHADARDRPSIPGYLIEGTIGAGGFGAVYRARRERDQVPVAIKVSAAGDPIALAQLGHEQEVLGQIGPPAVPRLHDSGQLETGARFLVMEDLGDTTLGTLLAERETPLSGEELLPLISALLDSVEAIHTGGFVHRDLKPDNVFVHETDGGYTSILVDFGLARSVDSALRSANLTTGREIAGSAEYMAPEQCAGSAHVDQRVDIYAIGVILYEALTGRVPFWGLPSDVRRAQQTTRAERPSRFVKVPPALEEVVLRCLAKDPRHRFETAGELAHALTAALALPTATLETAGIEPPRHTKDDSGPAPRIVAAFELDDELTDTLAILRGNRAALVRSSGRAHVAVVELDDPDAAMPVAVTLARALLDATLCPRVLLDVVPLAARVRRDGSRRYLGGVSRPLLERVTQLEHEGVLLAGDARRHLRTSTATPIPSERLWRVDDAATPPEGSVPMVGRDKMLRVLTASAAMAFETRTPTIATVIAEPGYGKTRLLAALRQRLPPEIERIDIEATDANTSANADLEDLLRRTLGLDDGGDAQYVRSTLAGAIGEDLTRVVWPGVARALDYAHAGDVDSVERASAAPGALRDMAVRAAGEALRSVARDRPLIVLIDDAQLADRTVLDALEHASLTDTEAPIWICAFARPDFDAARPNWGDRAERHERIRMAPLGASAARELCRAMLRPATEIPTSVVTRLVDASRGVPLHLIELCRCLRRTGALRPHTKGRSWYVAADQLDDLPHIASIDWLAERELSTLGDSLAAHARLAALLATPLDPAILDGVTSQLDRDGLGKEFPLDPNIAIDQLVKRRVLTRAEDGQLQFRHALFRDAIASSITPDRARALHASAYRYYQSLSGDGPRRLLARAYHAAKAALPSAARLYLQSAHRLQTRHAYLESAQAYGHALDNLGADAVLDRAEAWRGRAAMLYRIGRYEDSLVDFEQALGLARASGDGIAQAEILLDQATALDWIDELSRSASCVRTARSLIRDPAPLLEARLLAGEGRSFARAATWDSAIMTLSAAVDRCDALGHEAYETLVVSLLMLGPIQSSHGDVASARRTFDRLVELTRSAGDRLHLAATLNNRRYVWIADGDIDRIRDDADQVIQIGRELGMLAFEFGALVNVGEILMLSGDLDGAEPYVQRAVSAETRRSGRLTARLLRVRWLLYRENLDGTRTAFAELDALDRKARAAGRDDACVLPEERVLADMCRLATSNAPDHQWSSLSEEATMTPFDQQPLEILEQWARCALRRGDRDRARQCLERAIELAERAPNVMVDRLRSLLPR